MLTFSVFNHCLSLTVYFLTRGGSRPWAKKGRGGWLFVACSANFSSVCKFFLTQNKGGGGGGGGARAPPPDPPLLTPSNNLSVDYLEI